MFVTGIVNVISFPGIFRAFDPSQAVMCKRHNSSLFIYLTLHLFLSSGFVRTGEYELLAGVLLAVTGCEAMFAK